MQLHEIRGIAIATKVKQNRHSMEQMCCNKFYLQFIDVFCCFNLENNSIHRILWVLEGKKIFMEPFGIASEMQR